MIRCGVDQFSVNSEGSHCDQLVGDDQMGPLRSWNGK